MTAKLEKTLKREITIDGQPYTVAISPEGVKLTKKGFRLGQEVSWKTMLGEAGGEAGGESRGSGGGGAVNASEGSGMSSGNSAGGTS